MYLFKKKNVELVVIRNSINPTERDIEYYMGDDWQTLLRQAFGNKCLSKNIRLYHQHLTLDCDVTPTNTDEVDKFLRLQGQVYAVVSPMGLDPVSWAIIGISILVSVAVALLIPKPAIPNIGGGTQPPSPNNALARRSNRERLGGRIPDIFGEVWAVPDLIAPTYSVYINHDEIEYSFMCLGRGEYEILDIRDDNTKIEQISGATVQVFDPNMSIFDIASYEYGNAMTKREQELSKLSVRRYSAVNGQVLVPPNNFLPDKTDIIFAAPNIIRSLSEDFTGQFSVGEYLKIEQANDLPSDSSDETYTLNGDFEILEVKKNEIILNKPDKLNKDWAKLKQNNEQTRSGKVTLSTKSQNLWQGWFYTDDDKSDGIMINVVAPHGIYISHRDKTYTPFNIRILIEAQMVDEHNNPRGDIITLDTDIEGRKAKVADTGFYESTSNEDARRTAAQTYFLQIKGRCRVRIRRFSFKKNPQQDILYDELKIKDLYSYRLLKNINIDNSDCTLVYVKQRATEGALSIKERKIKLLVQRKIKNWQDNDNLFVSKRADDIIYHIATDEKIGNLTKTQIDIEQIKAEVDLLINYFGNSQCAEFCHTFDSNNLSSEETLQTVAQAIFSQLYRYHNQLQLYFERPQNVGVAIFNSHNILPDSYQRSESFGINKNYDGVIVKYTDDKDDAQITLYHPDKSVANADEHTLVGVRNKQQAIKHMMRIYNKHLYSNSSVEFDGTDESNIVVRSQRIEVADQFRADTTQGVVTDLQVSNGQIVLSVSEPISEYISNGTIFIQMTNGQVDIINATRLDRYQFRLSRLPQHTISISQDNVVQASYHFVSNSNNGRYAYLVTSKEFNDNMSNRITAINYDSRYYSGDK